MLALWHWGGRLESHKPLYAHIWINSQPTLLPNHNKNPDPSPFLTFSRNFERVWGICPILSRDLDYVSNFLFISSWCVFVFGVKITTKFSVGVHLPLQVTITRALSILVSNSSHIWLKCSFPNCQWSFSFVTLNVCVYICVHANAWHIWAFMLFFSTPILELQLSGKWVFYGVIWFPPFIKPNSTHIRCQEKE